MSETTEHTAATLKLMQVNGQLLARAETAEAEALRIHHEKADHFEARIAAEARCKRLENALRIAVEELEFDHEHGVVGRTGERRLVDRALDLARKALSDTAQQETGILCDSGGGSNLLAVMTDHKAAEMRERAAKLAEGWWPSTPLNMLAARIRDLPIDPETGGVDEK